MLSFSTMAEKKIGLVLILSKDIPYGWALATDKRAESRMDYLVETLSHVSMGSWRLEILPFNEEFLRDKDFAATAWLINGAALPQPRHLYDLIESLVFQDNDI